MKQRSAIIGFILAPLAPSVLFAVGAIILGSLSDVPLELPISGYFLGLFIWFLYAVVVAYPVTLLIGIPGYLLYKKYGFTSFKSYAAGGIVLGSLAPLLLMPIFGAPETLNLNWWLFLISGFFGFITCASFWLLVKNPNKKG
ncbi:MAG: hypothetical protein KAU21_16430 [Gammaproteobacteria bacterium]|nr:hypothetical protein [Gammaproteobacteria bacterium]